MIQKYLKNILLQIKAGRVSNEEELRDVVDQASARGLVEESEREMIQSVFDLDETLVRELMVPRTEMVWIEGNRNLRQGLSLALRSGYTRIPVIKENLDNVIGIAYVKDLAKRVLEDHAREQSELVEENLRKATFVPENKTAADLLKEMQRNQIHMAIVVDEYGGTAGLITIEDIIEEIVGEIADEYDAEDGEIKQDARSGEYEVDALTSLEDLYEETGIAIPDGPYETAGGYLMHTLGRIPQEHDVIHLNGRRITVLTVEGKRAGKLLISSNEWKDMTHGS